MNYPLISEYVEAIRFAEDNFSTLTNLRPVMENGRPFMSSGNFAVVFKMKDVTTGKLYAVKCFTREEEHRERSYRLISDELNGVDSPYLTSIKYLEKELFVDVSGSAENEFPILLMDWVEGQTMDAFIRENINDKWELERLCQNFCRMGAWLLEQPFAHGDLKPDNIMIGAGAMPLLVDYDGMYVPAMKGEVARELGSPDYRHPLRIEKDFDEHIDDFPLASIALSLKAISLDPSLLTRYGAADRLLFKKADYTDLSKCGVLREVTSLFSDPEIQKLHSIFLLASSQKSLPTSMSQMFIPTDSENDGEIPSTEVTEEDLAEAWEDEYGVLYSKDRKRLLTCKNKKLTEYVVSGGTKVICDWAFHYSNLHSIKSPDSLVAIGKGVFCGSKNLTLIELPKNLQFVENSFCCAKIINKSSFFKIEGNLLIQNKTVIGVTGNPQSVNVPNYVTTIGRKAFCGCRSLTSIKLPNSLISIEERAFDRCENLTSIKLPCGLTSIENETFSQCINLSSIEFPDSLTSIGNEAFFHCKNLKEIKLPDDLTSIGDSAFLLCDNLTLVELPDRLTSIGDMAFWGCENLKEIELPKNLREIKGNPFENCNVRISNYSPHFKTENDLLIRDNSVICVNGNPKSITVPKYVTNIGKRAFYGCKDLTLVVLPEGLTSIGNNAFERCERLTSITMSETIETIGHGVFRDCCSLQEICIKCGLNSDLSYVKEKFKELIPTRLHDIIFAVYRTIVVYRTDVTDGDLAEAWRDEYGVLYSKDRTRLLKCENCNLTEYNVAEGTVVICDTAFEMCLHLLSLHLPNSLRSVGDGTFRYCERLTSINLPEGLTSIGDWVFEGCNKLSITLRENLREINGNIFAGCNEIQILNKSPYFKIENDLLIQDQSVICAIGNPRTIIVPPYITHIGEKAFYKCTNLKSINLSENLLSIGEWAFDGCTNLSTISLPKSLQQISGNPFMDCNIQISSKSPYFRIENDLLIHDKTVICVIGNPKIVIMPNYITNIGEDAFDGCTNLTDIKLSENLKTIGDMAFWDCESLISMNLPDSLSTIGNYVFDMCSKLSSIIFPENIMFSGDDTQFYDCDELEEIQIRCNPDSDFSSVKEKFQKILPPELWDKIEIVEKK